MKNSRGPMGVAWVHEIQAIRFVPPFPAKKGKTSDEGSDQGGVVGGGKN